MVRTCEAPAMALLLHVISGVSFNLQWVFSSACVSQLHLLACGVAGGSHSALHVSAISSFTCMSAFHYVHQELVRQLDSRSSSRCFEGGSYACSRPVVSHHLASGSAALVAVLI
jgi:hypothetical protein